MRFEALQKLLELNRWFIQRKEKKKLENHFSNIFSNFLSQFA